VQPGADDETDLLAFLARYVAQGHAAAGVAGSLSTSAAVIRAGLRGLGANGLVVGSFLMERAGRRTTFADCSGVPEPDPDGLAQIAAAAVDHPSFTGEQQRLALLSFSTHGSARHPTVDRVRVATELLARRRPDLLVEGEVQLDVALDAAAVARKLPSSAVAGEANVLVFPTLDAGNISHKLAECWGGARALGSFVLNLQHPWVDLSRGCSQADTVDTALLFRQEVLARAAERLLREAARCSGSLTCIDHAHGGVPVTTDTAAGADRQPNRLPRRTLPGCMRLTAQSRAAAAASPQTAAGSICRSWPACCTPALVSRGSSSPGAPPVVLGHRPVVSIAGAG
jgi:predicted methyltransferase MtxX (methanogen marker protein 4)